MLGLRIAEGVDEANALADAGALGRREALESAIERQRRAGLVLRRGGRVIVSESGWLHADAAASVLMASLED